jgi:hypothetical protein
MENNNSNLPKDLGEIEPTSDVGEENNAGLPKNLSFRDFMVVDTSYTKDDYLAYQSQKRHRGTVGESVEDVEEVLSHAQRIKAGLRMKKMSKRIGMARKRAMKRTPTMDTFKKRANRQARRDMFKTLTRGQNKGDVSIAKRADIEKRLDRLKPRISRMAMRMLPTIRKKDRDRKNKTGGKK